MSFTALILKNVVRRPVRTALAVLGISLGIATVVALGVISGSLLVASEELLRLGGADFMVAQKGTADLSFSIVREADWQAIARRSDVARAMGVVVHVTRVGANPYFFLVGVRPEQLREHAPTMRAGTLLATGAVDWIALGDRAAESLGLSVDDVLTIDSRPLQVVGIYHTGRGVEDSGGYAALSTVQEIARRPGVVTAVYVTVREGVDRRRAADALEEEFPQLTTVASLAEYGEVDQGPRIIEAANLAISILAIVIGAIGVMNTMVMSVFERTHEIGVLRAVGWSGFRILRMIVGESVLLCVVSAGIGSLLGVLTTRGLTLIPAVREVLPMEYTADVFVRALLLALAVAFTGAAYPALWAVRLAPMEALRYE